jgi:hypothetical protein
MNLEENPPPKTPVEMRFNVFNGATGQQLNAESLTSEEAHKLASQLQEHDAGAPLVIRSTRTILME